MIHCMICMMIYRERSQYNFQLSICCKQSCHCCNSPPCSSNTHLHCSSNNFPLDTLYKYCLSCNIDRSIQCTLHLISKSCNSILNKANTAAANHFDQESSPLNMISIDLAYIIYNFQNCNFYTELLISRTHLDMQSNDFINIINSQAQNMKGTLWHSYQDRTLQSSQCTDCSQGTTSIYLSKACINHLIPIDSILQGKLCRIPYQCTRGIYCLHSQSIHSKLQRILNDIENIPNYYKFYNVQYSKTSISFCHQQGKSHACM